MEVALVALLMGALAILVVVRFDRKKAFAGNASTLSTRKASRKSTVKARSPYRATSILSGASACDAVQAIRNVMFLDVDRNIPKLPMSNRKCANCTCRYVHHDDRRQSTEDRRHPNALQSEFYLGAGNTNRRMRAGGRRKSDWA